MPVAENSNNIDKSLRRLAVSSAIKSNFAIFNWFKRLCSRLFCGGGLFLVFGERLF
jgi:hypothetical protein